MDVAAAAAARRAGYTCAGALQLSLPFPAQPRFNESLGFHGLDRHSLSTRGLLPGLKGPCMGSMAMRGM
jgi:hypothetical protein